VYPLIDAVYSVINIVCPVIDTVNPVINAVCPVINTSNCFYVNFLCTL